jgi:hypothetical protein
MNRIHELAQLLVSSWAITGDDDKIPTSHGLLDRALKSAADSGALPEWAKINLHFVDSRIGLQCVELGSILEWAQKSELTSTPNPSYSTTQVQIKEGLARKILRKLSVSEPEAKLLGDSLRKSFEGQRPTA